MTIGLEITIIALGILIFFIIIFQLTSVKIKLQFKIDKKNLELNAKIEENRFQKYQKKLGKNKWLYTTDNFGKMEKGRVL